MVRRWARSKVATDSGYLSQAREIHHYSGQHNICHLEHENGNKRHNRGTHYGNLTRYNTNPIQHDHTKKMSGYNNVPTLATNYMKIGTNEEVKYYESAEGSANSAECSANFTEGSANSARVSTNSAQQRNESHT